MERLQVTPILQRVRRASLGLEKMSGNELRAAEMIISRCIPTLASVEFFGEVDLNVIQGTPIKSEDWAKAHVIDGQAETVTERPALELKADAPKPDPIALAAEMANG